VERGEKGGWRSPDPNGDKIPRMNLPGGGTRRQDVGKGGGGKEGEAHSPDCSQNSSEKKKKRDLLDVLRKRSSLRGGNGSLVGGRPRRKERT